jgi:arylsulfatase
MVGLAAAREPGTGVNMATQALPNVLHQGEALETMNQSPISLGSGWANACNTPLRLYKHYAHEGGISTPFIAHWPAGIEGKDQWITTPAHLVDVMATCADLAGAAYPEPPVQPMEGVSLAPLLRGKAIEKRTLFFEHENNAAVRDGDWKLVRTGRGGHWELYHITGDRVEMHDVAGDHPDMVENLSKQWDAWAKRCQVLPNE